MNAQHLSLSDSWMTPVDIVERVRDTLGSIDLDPASSVEANGRVKATYIYDESCDGLRQPWFGVSGSVPANVFCNPPGGKYPKGHPHCGKSKPKQFWQKLMAERRQCHISNAVFLFFSLEGLSNCQSETLSPLAFPTCIPKKRIRFDPPPGVKDPGPTHANAIVYVRGFGPCRREAFIDAFEDLGDIVELVTR